MLKHSCFLIAVFLLSFSYSSIAGDNGKEKTPKITPSSTSLPKQNSKLETLNKNKEALKQSNMRLARCRLLGSLAEDDREQTHKIIQATWAAQRQNALNFVKENKDQIISGSGGDEVFWFGYYYGKYEEDEAFIVWLKDLQEKNGKESDITRDAMVNAYVKDSCKAIVDTVLTLFP